MDWKHGDTIYFEPSWEDLSFCDRCHGRGDERRFNDLREHCEAILLTRYYGLIAVQSTIQCEKKTRAETRKETRKWYKTFEDAVDALALRKMNYAAKLRDRAAGAQALVERLRTESRESG